MFPATQLKVGMTVLYEKEPHRVVSVRHVTPGKGRGMVFSRLQNLKTGAAQEYRFRSDEQLERTVLDSRDMDFSYESHVGYAFMDAETYEIVELTEELVGDAVKYILPGTRIKVQSFEGTPVGVEVPLTVELKIVETEPPMKGATASASSKAAKLETGLVVKVPQFMQVGELVKIDTRDDSFIERVN